MIELRYYQRLTIAGQPTPTFEAIVLEVFYAHNKDKFVMSLVGEVKVLALLNALADKTVKSLYRKLDSRQWEEEYSTIEAYLESILWKLETTPTPA